MASTVYDDSEISVKYSGFSQEKYDKVIGNGLTEGYTEYLAKTYFSDNECNKYIKDVYVIEMMLAKSLETIVGKEKMKKFYFTSDLKGLIEELKNIMIWII